MEVQALTLSLSEQDLNDLLRKYLPRNQPIEDLAVGITPQGLRVTGVYPLFINVHFETQWQLGIDHGLITARLHQFKAMGVPGNIFKSAIVKMIEDVAGAEEWLRIEGDTILIDVDRSIAKYAFSARMNLQRIHFRDNQIVVEGGAGQDVPK